MEVRGKRVLVMGLGRHGGGVAAARWLAGEGAEVTVTDTAGAAALADSIAELSDANIAHWHLGGHSADDFGQAEIVVVNPAVRLDNSHVARARVTGATITSELELLLRRLPCPAVAVTGSNGKSTTAAMIAAILTAAGRVVYLGGNIGRSLLPELRRMTPDSWAVLEVSSFQLAWLSNTCPLPQIGVLTNFSPNHLDWHGTLEEYASAKARLFVGEHAARVAVLGDESLSALPGVATVAGKTALSDSSEKLPPLRVPGDHNRRNAACAAAAARAAGCSQEAIQTGLRQFSGLPHRLELVGATAGREFYNDSMATTPESAAAALETFTGRAWLLAGGYDKGVDYAPLVTAIGQHARGAALYGATGPRLFEQLRAAGARCPLALFETLDAATGWCWEQSRAGDCIVLSPASASYDQFVDYRERGARFTALAQSLGASLPEHDEARDRASRAV